MKYTQYKGLLLGEVQCKGFNKEEYEYEIIQGNPAQKNRSAPLHAKEGAAQQNWRHVT